VEQVPDCLERVLIVVSRCLSDMRDDLSSSVGFVMDLLGDLVKYDKVIEVLADESIGLPLSTLAPVLYPFFRHTIANVRLAVVQTLSSFMDIESLPKTWMDATFLRLIFQNLVLEERSDIRDSTLHAWRSALTTISAKEGWLESITSESLLRDWFTMMMTPLGVPLNTSLFFHPTFQSEDHVPRERHNVDLNMKRQDLAILSIDVVLKARIAASHALAFLFVCWPSTTMEAMFRPIFMGYVDSTSILQKLLASIISEEWAHEYDQIPSTPTDPKPLLIDVSPMAKEISDMSLAWLQGNPLPAYHEMLINLHGILKECQALLQSFALDCRLPVSSIPYLGVEVDVTDTRQGCFTITTAKTAVGSMYDSLKASLGRTKKKELAVIGEKRLAVVAMIDRYADLKAEHDNRVSATVAAAFVALKSTPDKVSPVVKGIMNGIKNEENLGLQTRSAVAVAAFVSFCVDKGLGQPAEKIVKNLCTFLCQDSEQTPTFSYTRQLTDGILSFRDPLKPGSATNGKDGKEKMPLPDPNSKAYLPRRGASLAFRQLSVQFGPKLLQVIPKMWHSMAGGLLSAFPSGKIDEETDNEIEKSYGQDIIDSLSVLEATVPTFDENLWPKLIEIFPIILLALRSRFAIIRQAAAKCVSTVCDVITVESMHFVIDQVIPLLSDPLSLHNRQGATELIYHIVQKLDIKALPYVIFLVVPILGRMSDSDEAIRSTATNTFASLVKMVPLESGLPDPPGFSEELLKRREDERQFLFQLLDGSKVEQYEIPVTIKAELRKYQQEGVNWLAFLAKYQLHGILCDDMGLGKTLQSICILASKHCERKKRHEETKSPDSVHLPSLIVCPPTLTGHWYYEILKYADNLKPMLYTGNARDRTKRLSAIKGYDVVITSYDIVRNDVNHLEPINWLYCILDEGHIIKNARTKLTKAVKCMKSQHRLILSGTPIQNNVLELWSLFDFLMPGFLGTESSFSERFSKPILANRDGKSKNSEAAALALEALHKQVLPFLLRRLKEDVLNDLPPKIIQDYYCELSDLQKVLYDDFSGSSARTTAEGAVNSVDLAEKSSEQTHVFQALQYLRKLCNHPALVLKNDKEAISSAMSKIGSKPDTLRDMQHAPKLQALKQLLNDCGIGLAAGASCDLSKTELLDTDGSSSSVTQHRVLIFCQMKQMLDIIETDLFKPHMPSVTYMRLDGGTDASKRHAIVQTFNSDPSIDCLLLTTHVGGLGLTLTGADTVIFVEHDWNPMKDLQAMDRAHRIGQKKVVNVYRLISKGTLEEKIMGLQRFKLNIANSIVTQQNSGMASMDTDLVLDLFKRTGEEEDALAANKKKLKESSSTVSQKNVLQALQDLPAEDEYDALDLSSFMSSLGR
jgi:TATA-binding protein-associated factor